MRTIIITINILGSGLRPGVLVKKTTIAEKRRPVSARTEDARQKRSADVMRGEQAFVMDGLSNFLTINSAPPNKNQNSSTPMISSSPRKWAQ